jgi:hypothetical protein
VHEDLSNHLDPGIIVKEKVGRLIRRSEVRPAGTTRQRLDLEKHITEPEPPAPLPENCLKIEPLEEEATEPSSSLPASEAKPVQARKLYQKDDKIVLKDTGEVLTVVADLSDQKEQGIIVQEKPGYAIMSGDVRPAGSTRQRLEADE